MDIGLRFGSHNFRVDRNKSVLGGDLARLHAGLTITLPSLFPSLREKHSLLDHLSLRIGNLDRYFRAVVEDLDERDVDVLVMVPGSLGCAG